MPDIKLKPLKGKKLFDELFKSGKRVNYKECSAVYLESKQINNPKSNRIIFYAVIISKKVAKKAVLRNRVKRLLRESLRMAFKEDENLFENLNQIALLWKAVPEKPYMLKLWDVYPTVREILYQIKAS